MSAQVWMWVAIVAVNGISATALVIEIRTGRRLDRSAPLTTQGAAS